MAELKPSSFWRRQCPAVQTVPEGGTRRCDLARNHEGDHAAEFGMYWIGWSAQSRVI